MPLLADIDYRVVDWTCPKCGIYYGDQTIGLRSGYRPSGPFHDALLFCARGCARYFTASGKDVTATIPRPKEGE